MPAWIEITGGPSAGTTLWMTRPIMRLGSDAAMDLQIEGIAGHAVTVQFRDRRYFVYRRDPSLVRLAGVPLADDSAKAWRAGQALQLGEQTTLCLRIEGDPAPAAASSGAGQCVGPMSRDAPQSSSERSPTDSSKSAGRSRQMTIVGSFMLVFGAYLFLFQGDGMPPDSVQEQFHHLVEDLLRFSPPEDSRLQSLRPKLQEAYRWEITGCTGSAVQRYKEIRTMLLHRRGVHDRFAAEPFISELERRSQAFVCHRLETLGRR